MSESAYDVVVIGGGIAGLAAAWHLARARGPRVCLLEREPIFAAHASGRNAAIFRHLEPSVTAITLARRTDELLGLLGDPDTLVRRSGGLFVSAGDELAPWAELARRHGLAALELDRAALARRAPALAAGDARRGLFVPADGVLDIHAVTDTLARQARAAGATLRTGAQVAAIRRAGGRVRGVELEGGETLEAGAVVIAAGAWSRALGASAGAELPLTPLRRHLALLVAEDRPGARPLELVSAMEPGSPVVWRVDDGDEVYFRAESGGLLASPCDEDPWPPGVPPSAEEPIVRLGERLGRLAPALSRTRVRTTWACLRTFAPDRELLAGDDPRCGGLYFITALGGRGMSCGLALGESLSTQILGQGPPLPQLWPSRLLDSMGKIAGASSCNPGPAKVTFRECP